MSDPFTIRVFVADGDPQGVRIVDRLNWTGVGVVFPRDRWKAASKRDEFGRAGVYILFGYKEDDEDIPTLYIGESDVLRNRIENHFKEKDFWTIGYAFTTSNNGLNKAHVRWLESELIQQAKKADGSRLENGSAPPEPPLSEADRSDTRAFLGEILQVLPILGLRAFEARDQKIVATPLAPEPISSQAGVANSANDTVVVVPAQEENFKKMFLEEHRWAAIRISGGKLHKIRYITAYQTKPVMAVTHYAPVKTIELYGESGKYQLIFSGSPVPITPIPFADAPSAMIMGPRYTTLGKLFAAKVLKDLF